jgi:DNA-binding Xre family transcriptional regulator
MKGKANLMIKLRVKEVAESKGISRTRLSRLADTNYKTINAIFQNPYKEVTTTTLERLARALGVSVVDLIEELPDEEHH